jgi:hypothetical protein
LSAKEFSQLAKVIPLIPIKIPAFLITSANASLKILKIYHFVGKKRAELFAENSRNLSPNEIIDFEGRFRWKIVSKFFLKGKEEY